MTTAEENWKLFIIAAVVTVAIAGAVSLGVAVLPGFGFAGTLGAILIVAIILAVLGVFATTGLFWLIFVMLRIRDSLERSGR